MAILKAKIPNNEYLVRIEDNLLMSIEEYIDVNSELVVITDSNVALLYLERITNKLSNFKTYIVEPGEKSKTMETAYSLINFMISDNITRGATIIALGGGVIGDLAGFVASIYMRGINLIQVPTTLLSQIDSSIGGKVGINSDSMKNSIGSFYQPSQVLIDPQVLKTLPKRELNNGYSEMIKYGIISSKPLFEALEVGIKLDDINKYIIECINIKLSLVIDDVYDTGLRQLLNFGHTIGHAIEQYSRYTLLHGEAIAVGMAKISKNEEYFPRLLKLLDKYNLPNDYEYDKNEVYQFIVTDKKVKGDILNIITVKSLGKALVEPIDKNRIKLYL